MINRYHLWLVIYVVVVGALALITIVSTDREVSRSLHLPVIRRASSVREIVHGDTSKKQVIFTFDGGDGNQSALGILTALHKHGVKGTFFLTGKFIENNPNLVREMVVAGHEIFSHTYDHPHLPMLTDAEIREEFQKMEETLQKTAGVSSKPYFRPPYGDVDNRVRHEAFLAGYQSVYWTVDAHDWEETEGVTADQVRQQILDNLAPGTIYLMHFGDTITGAILDEILTEVEKRGYKPVALTQGL